MSNSDIEQTGTVKGHIPNGASLSGRISNVMSLSGHISIGSGAGDFIIKMTLAIDDDGNYTLASCDATIEQIDAAVAAEKRVVVIASDGGTLFELPMLQGAQGVMYSFGMFLNGQMLTSFVEKIDESTSKWQFLITQIEAESVNYSNAALTNVANVRGALDELVPNSHTHTNKSVLDKFSETDGKPTYDGKKISGASTAEEVEYTNAILPDASNVKSALDDTIDTQQTQSADLESLRAGVSALMNAYQTQGGDIASLKTQSHTHANKSVLDKFAESDGKLQYNGQALNSDGGTLIIKCETTATAIDGSSYRITAIEPSAEDILEAYNAGKQLVIKAHVNDNYIWLPLIQYTNDDMLFGAFIDGLTVLASFTEYESYIELRMINAEVIEYVYSSTNNIDWLFNSGNVGGTLDDIIFEVDTLDDVSYSLQDNVDKLTKQSHTHSNKEALDKLSVSNGKLQYNGSDVGLKGDKGDTPVKGIDYWTESDKAEIVADTLAALPTWNGGGY